MPVVPVGVAVTEITKVAVPVPPELVAPMVTGLLPTAVGVPMMRPVVALTVKPAGRPLALLAVGLPLAVIW